MVVACGPETAEGTAGKPRVVRRREKARARARLERRASKASLKTSEEQRNRNLAKDSEPKTKTSKPATHASVIHSFVAHQTNDGVSHSINQIPRYDPHMKLDADLGIPLHPIPSLYIKVPSEKLEGYRYPPTNETQRGPNAGVGQARTRTK